MIILISLFTFFPGISHNIAEILLKLVLNTNQSINKSSQGKNIKKNYFTFITVQDLKLCAIYVYIGYTATT